MVCRLGLVQMNCSAERKVNVDRAEGFIREAARNGAQVLLLPEVFHEFFFATRLDMKCFDLAEPIPGPITERMQSVAKELGVVLVVPLFERVERSVYYNSAAVIDADGRLLGVYRKTHIPLGTVFFEKFYFKPGNLGYPVFETAFGKLGVYICHDRHYPEGARALALGGAEILLIPSATSDGSLSGRVWEKELIAHAIFNELYVAGLNRVGREDRQTYYGRSLVADPVGEIIAQAGQDEEVLMADCDLEVITERRRAWQFYRDRRPDAYGILTRLVP